MSVDVSSPTIDARTARLFIVLTVAEAEALTAVRLKPDQDAALRALAKIRTALAGSP